MRYGVTKNRKTLVLHTFSGVSSRSDCGKAEATKLDMFNSIPSDFYKVCEHCTHNRPRLRDKIYNGG